MKNKLENIATIASGVYEKAHPSGDTHYLQGKHFDEFGRIREDLVFNPEIQADERLGKHLLQDGDILLIAKGDSNRACLYQKEIGQAVASSIFFVIRLKVKTLLPEFLRWYFNTPYMKEVFSGLSRGTQIPSLPKSSLSEIEIPVPPLEKQQEILDIQQLWEKEKSLTIDLLNLKETWYQQILHNQIKPTFAE